MNFTTKINSLCVVNAVDLRTRTRSAFAIHAFTFTRALVGGCFRAVSVCRSVETCGRKSEPGTHSPGTGKLAGWQVEIRAPSVCDGTNISPCALCTSADWERERLMFVALSFSRVRYFPKHLN